MKKMLLTGASGFLGWNICRWAGKGWEIYGTVFSHPIQIPGVKIVQVDLRDFREVKKIFDAVRPDAVVHTAAAANINFCQTHPKESHQINVDVSMDIAGLCADRSIACVFTSSDLVFDGQCAPYCEEDPVSPVNVYGEQKILAEEGMLKRYPDVIICRMSLMFGDPGPVASSFVQPMIAAMREARPLKLFVDEFRTPLSGRDAAAGIFLALKKAKGILHLGGRERISRYEIGVLLRDILGFTEKKAALISCRQRDVHMPAPRAADVSFDITKAQTLGFHPVSLPEALKDFTSFENRLPSATAETAIF